MRDLLYYLITEVIVSLYENNHCFIIHTGVDAGLRLTLNVEQYEYMTGPHDAAGVKMLLHDSREMPIVHELGQAIPTGSHAFVGVKFMTVYGFNLLILVLLVTFNICRRISYLWLLRACVFFSFNILYFFDE